MFRDLGKKFWLVVLVSLVLVALTGCVHNPPALPTSWNNTNLARINTRHTGPFSFAILGDNRGGKRVFERMLKEIGNDSEILFVIDLGDTVQRGDRWEYFRFFDQVKKNIRVPFLVVPGNHEVKGNPDISKNVLGKCYYSFCVGDIAFIVLSSTSSKGIDERQKKWLVRELEKYKEMKQRLIFMHYPLFDPSGSFFPHALSKKAATELLLLFKKFRVTHVFAGHIHGFFKGKWDGIPFTISGGGGAKLMGDDPAHYFFHYLKVEINGKTLQIMVQPVSQVENSGDFWARFAHVKDKVNSGFDSYRRDGTIRPYNETMGSSISAVNLFPESVTDLYG